MTPSATGTVLEGHGKWAKSAIRAILLNPRYTGFEVWNKQRKDEVLIDVDDVALGHVTKQRWNAENEWIWSSEPTHDSIVIRELFDAARGQFTKRGPTTHTPREGRHYVLSGLLHCGVCGRRMQGQWNHDRAYYRCNFTADYPGLDAEHPRSVYVQEDAVIPGLDEWLGSRFDDEHLDDTCNALAGVSEPDPAVEPRSARLRVAIADCDRKIRNYRRLLDDEDSVSLAAGWIAETQRERKALERQLGEQRSGDRLTTGEVKALVTTLQDIVGVLADAEPADKADL